MLLEEPNTRRFRISQEEIKPVVDEQLIPEDLTDKWSYNPDSETFDIFGLVNEEQDEDWSYKIQIDRFRIS